MGNECFRTACPNMYAYASLLLGELKSTFLERHSNSVCLNRDMEVIFVLDPS